MSAPVVMENTMKSDAKIPDSVEKESLKSAEDSLPKFKKGQVQAGAKLILEGMGLDLTDPNFIETPQRVARAFKEFCGGLYNMEKTATEILGKSFPSTHNEIVFCGPVRSVGVCPHHLLPVVMDSYFAYLPSTYVVGLSKIPRFIKLMSSRPVLQEDLAKDIVDGFMRYVKPEGAALHINAVHSCMAHRGVGEHNASVSTVAVRGVFREDPSIKDEFLTLMGMRR